MIFFLLFSLLLWEAELTRGSRPVTLCWYHSQPWDTCILRGRGVRVKKQVAWGHSLRQRNVSQYFSELVISLSTAP